MQGFRVREVQRPSARLITALATAALVAGSVCTLHAERFHRGDATADGNINLTDSVFILSHLFSASESPSCRKSADVDDSGSLEITDAIYLLNYLFIGGPAPPAPFLDCDEDPTPDSLDCLAYPDLDQCVGSASFDELLATYGVVETIAGLGAFGGRGNVWLPEYEGGPATEAELSRPHNTMGDLAGNYYIADKEAHAIRKVSPDGIITTIAGTGEAGDDGDDPAPGRERSLNDPNGLYVHGDGTCFILDTANNKVRRLGTDGVMTTLFATPTPLGAGRGLWVSADERLVYCCATTLVYRWTPDEGVEVFSDGYFELGNIDVDPDGFLAVTDRGAHRAYRLDADGEPTPIAGDGGAGRSLSGMPALETSLEEVRGIAFRPDGSYFLGLHEGSQVWFVDTSGIAFLFLDGFEDFHGGDGERFETPGFKVSEIRNVTIDAAGNIIVTENDRGFIRRVRRM